MKHRKNLYSIILILVMLISSLRQENECNPLAEDEFPNRQEIDIEE